MVSSPSNNVRAVLSSHQKVVFRRQKRQTFDVEKIYFFTFYVGHSTHQGILLSRCFVGCFGQALKRCNNRCCCDLRNYASDVRPTDPIAAGVESPSQYLAPGVVLCSTAGLKYKIYSIYQPSDRRGSLLVRHVKCLTFLHVICDAEKKNARKKSSLSTSNFTSRTRLFHI